MSADPLICANCCRAPRCDENTDDHWLPQPNGVGELHLWCPECWKQEFGSLRIQTEADAPLVDVWRLYASGHADEARQKLARVWSFGVDGASRRVARVALRLLRRLAPVTDDVDAWEALPEVLVIHRAMSKPGLCWSLEREVAESLAHTHDLGSIQTATVRKVDVLAFITHNGEAEIVPEPNRMGM